MSIGCHRAQKRLVVARHHSGRTISDPNKLAIYEVGLRDDVLHQGRRLYVSSLGEACHALRSVTTIEKLERVRKIGTRNDLLSLPRKPSIFTESSSLEKAYYACKASRPPREL